MASQNEEGDRSPGLYRRAGQVIGTPGESYPPMLALLVTTTVLLGAASGWLLGSQGDSNVPVVAMVSPEQVPEAIATLSPSAQRAAKADSRECRFPMGFITVSTPGNPAGGEVRFRTSRYQSPVFQVTDKPQRIAIPNPLPERGGVDLLSVDGNPKGLLVSLYPSTHMEPVNGTAMVKVIWHPRPPCKS